MLDKKVKNDQIGQASQIDSLLDDVLKEQDLEQIARKINQLVVAEKLSTLKNS